MERELARTTISLGKLKERLFEVRQNLHRVITTAPDASNAVNAVRDLIKELKIENVDWTQVEKEFVVVHPEFRTRLCERFSSLTQQEVRLCQLAWIGLKSHEMASVLHVAERSIDNHRYNIRKKLGVSSSENLRDFLVQSLSMGRPES